MMIETTGIAAESAYWQELYDERPAHIFYDAAEHTAIVRELGELMEGQCVLEIGCGAGVWTANLAHMGATVFASDLTPAIARRAQDAASSHAALGLAADMHRLPFADGTFDVVFGSMVLHHAQDHTWLGREVARVLKPGGRAVFHENSARNSVLMLARRTLVGRFGIPRNSSPNEHPLRDEEIDAFGRAFAGVRVTIGRLVLAQMAVKYLLRREEGFIFLRARQLDDWLFAFVPRLRRSSYQQIITGFKSRD